MITKEALIAFEADIASRFEQAKIPSPVHLSGNNEDELIKIFQNIKPDDFVFSTHRSHYHALLKGIPPEWLKAEILDNRSITINNAEYKFFSSAIVGGILPIALGVAMAIKREDKWTNYDFTDAPRVWCFVGDMAAETGIFHECVKFSLGHELPVHFVVEDNGFSVLTPTEAVWRYSYQRKFPHQGSGKFILF